MTKNIGKSIRTRLLNLAKEEKQEYMKMLVRYLHERLLFRIFMQWLTVTKAIVA